MYIIKNAITSINRNIGRNILIGIIILLISCSCCITLAIRNSANRLISSYEKKYSVQATISMNRKNLIDNFNKNANAEDDNSSMQENVIKNFNEIASLTEDEINSYGSSKYVKSYYYTSSIYINSETLEKASQELTNNTKESIRNDKSIKNEKMANGDFKLIGYSSYESMNEFIEGNYTIVSGKISSDFNDSTCLINNELATINNINVGDEITFIDSDNKTYQLTVSGIYSDNTTTQDMASIYTDSVNTIITNTNVISSIVKNNSNINQMLTPTFILKNKTDIEDFQLEVENKGLNENYQVTTNIDMINNETQSIKNISNFATTFLILTLVIGSIILLVLNVINIRERKYEIGVLRTIGMKKRLVISQFVLELFIVSFISLIIGTGIGSILSVPTANKLLENEISTSNEQISNIEKNFGRRDDANENNMFDKNNLNGVVKLEKITSINAAVDLKIISELIVIGSILTLVSSAAAIYNINKFSPLTILKERS